MAKANDPLDEIMDEIKKNFKKIQKDAIKNVGNIALKDIYTKSINCLHEYYDNYEPYSYHRTDNLWTCIVPILNYKSTSKSTKVEVGVGFDAKRVGPYSGSSKYPVVDGEWVIDNFLAGIHPGTDGANDYNPSLYGQIDPISPTTRMSAFFEDYAKIVTDNMVSQFYTEAIQSIK